MARHTPRTTLRSMLVPWMMRMEDLSNGFRWPLVGVGSVKV